MIIPMRCRKFQARLEDYLEGSTDSEVDEHLAHCTHCSAALEISRLAGDLLRQVWEPASEPHQAFRAGVSAKIREEQSRAESTAAFWSPIEFLASRLSLAAAMVLLAASIYLVESTPHRTPRPQVNRTELSASDFPQPPTDPVSNEEVLQSLAERNNGQ
jgi:predicted anti-sigma-YlaC factor YlaD